MDFKAEYSPPDMVGNKRFDFAVFHQGTLVYLIEYDGVLHTQYSNRGWDTAERFHKMLASDHQKNAYCLQKKIPLIRIPYTRFAALSLEDLLLHTTSFLYTEAHENGYQT